MLLNGYGEGYENLFFFDDFVNNKNQIYNDALSFNKKIHRKFKRVIRIIFILFGIK